MKIKDIGTIITGKTPSTKQEDNYDGSIMFVTPEDVSKGYYIYRTDRTLSKKGFESIKNNTLDGISVLVNCIGNIGDVAIVKGKCATNQQINAITNFKENINPLYVYYRLKQYKSIFNNLAGNTVLKILPKRIFEEIEVDIHDIVEQNKIVSLLNNIDELINNNNIIIYQLESMAKTIYDYWFLQFEFPNEKGKPYKSSGGKMIWNEELKKEIPEGWTLTNIGNITVCHDSERIPVSNKDRENMKGKIPYYGATGIMGYVNKSIFNGDYVLMAEDGSVMDEKGKPILQRITGKTWVNNHAHVLEPKNGYSCKLLMMILKNIPVKKIKTGSIQMKINQENMNAYKIVQIPIQLRNLICDKLNIIDKKILTIEKENEKLTELRDFLLPLLMNGQVKIENKN